MDQTWQERLAEILKKEPAALTPGDIEFLRARRSYLTPEQMSAYAEALGEATPAEEVKEAAGEEPKPKKGSK